MALQKEKTIDIAVVGAGASGLAAAIAACRENSAASVLLLERAERVGQKILATGNGRCNLGNRSVKPDHFGGEAGRYAAVFAAFEGVDSFFGSMGLMLRTDEAGRIYPYSLQAAAVLDALRRTAEQAGAQTLCGFELCSLQRQQGAWLLQSSAGERIAAKRVILAVGSPASKGPENKPLLAELKGLGQQLRPFTAALCPLSCGDSALKALKGLRLRADVSLLENGRVLAKKSGEVQFGEGYIGGICVMDLCRASAEKPLRDAVLCLDTVPQLGEEALYLQLVQLRALCGEAEAASLLGGILPKTAGSALMKQCVAEPFKRTAASLTDTELRKIAAAMKNWRFAVNGTQGNAKAQVCAGGICGADGATLALPKTQGLYACGELLNVCGDCGGYNLHWAWASGIAAGKAAARSLL